MSGERGSVSARVFAGDKVTGGDEDDGDGTTKSMCLACIPRGGWGNFVCPFYVLGFPFPTSLGACRLFYAAWGSCDVSFIGESLVDVVICHWVDSSGDER
ncbi:hypothetical protein SUGI_1036490 [Cryptomeria japonica]|nr:hypothetical protein SUGI_1036490 [Cryptomeria japonica]